MTESAVFKYGEKRNVEHERLPAAGNIAVEDKCHPLQMGKLRPGKGKDLPPGEVPGHTQDQPWEPPSSSILGAVSFLFALTSQLPLSKPYEAPFLPILVLVEGQKLELGRIHCEVY